MFITAKQVQGLLDALDLDKRAVRTDYSGRGFYSADYCIGIVHDLSEVLIGVALATVIEDENQHWAMAREARTDNMGRSTITYFPGYQLEPADREEWESCERGTPGCSESHAYTDDCATW